MSADLPACLACLPVLVLELLLSFLVPACCSLQNTHVDWWFSYYSSFVVMWKTRQEGQVQI